jgi:DNA repair ATPase RecN
MLSRMEISAYASSERFIAEHHTVQIISSKSSLQKSWQSAVDYCVTIRCEVLSSRIYSANSATPPSGEINLRVVPDDFKKLMVRLGELGSIIEHSTQREDKTNSVIDTDAQLKNLISFRESLRTMILKSSAKVSDLVEIEKQLSETQAQIDSITLQRKALADEVEKIAVDVSFRAETASTDTSGLGQIARAFHQAGTVLADSIANLVTTVFFLLPWMIVGVPVIWFSMKLWRRRKFSAISEQPTLQAHTKP